MIGIDQQIDATSSVSKQVSGAQLSNLGSVRRDRQVTVQVVPSSNSAFEVSLEAAVNVPDAPTFDKIGSWTDSDDTLVAVLPINEGMLYRFRHESGVACRVLMTR